MKLALLHFKIFIRQVLYKRFLAYFIDIIWGIEKSRVAAHLIKDCLIWTKLPVYKTPTDYSLALF